MDTKLSNRLNNVAPSATFAISQKSSELKAAGVDVINMSVGEPDFNTASHIKAAAHEAIDADFSHYSPVSGYEDLRKTICAKLHRENGLEYTPSNIVVSNGAKQSITNAVLSLIGPGDEVIIPAPYWVSYPQMVNLAEGTPVFVDTSIDNDFKMTPDSLEAAITPATRLLILCSPCNPTGTVYSKEELEAIARVVMKHERLLVLSDEIYEHINYTGRSFSIASVPGMQERSIVVNGVSKAYAMTGWRIGFIAAPEWIAKACSKLQSQYSSGPCSISQKAALKAWDSSQESVEEMRQAFERRRDLIVKLASSIPGFKVNRPQGAFYLFPDCSSFFGKSYTPGQLQAELAGDSPSAAGQPAKIIASSTDFALYLLEEGHVATVGGDAFGCPSCFRISYATSEDNIREALKRIATAVSYLK